eukprot:scaffold1621_cov350-Prasinococcus_capsulatus_cf.AAC.17
MHPSRRLLRVVRMALGGINARDELGLCAPSVLASTAERRSPRTWRCVTQRRAQDTLCGQRPLALSLLRTAAARETTSLCTPLAPTRPVATLCVVLWPPDGDCSPDSRHQRSAVASAHTA